MGIKNANGIVGELTRLIKMESTANIGIFIRKQKQFAIFILFEQIFMAIFPKIKRAPALAGTLKSIYRMIYIWQQVSATCLHIV